MASPWRVRAVSFVAAVLLTLLTLPPAASAAPRSEAQAARQTGFGIWQAIPGLWQMIQSFFEKAGSSPDPFGNSKPNSVFAREGSSPDPFGGPKPSTVTDPSAGNLAGH